MVPETAAQRGYLLLADVSGYTAFLARSELDRASDILRVLFDELVAAVPAPFRVAEIEGDAVFAYTVDRAGVEGPALLDVVERLYFAFSGTRERLERNTDCGCVACDEFPELDLKLVVHHGEFILHTPLDGRTPKPAGRDVILAHRLLKNHVRETTGLDAYAVLTAAAVGRADLGDLSHRMARTAEAYEHFGEVDLFVHDLATPWSAERDRRNVVVDPAEAWFSIEADLPVPPAVAWSYLTEPRHKRRWTGADSVTASYGASGRSGVGTLHRCAHDGEEVLEEVVDWRPFEYVTCDGAGPAGTRVRTTTVLEPAGSRTHLRRIASRPRGTGMWPRVLGTTAGALFRWRHEVRTRRDLARLAELMGGENARPAPPGEPAGP